MATAEKERRLLMELEDLEAAWSTHQLAVKALLERIEPVCSPVCEIPSSEDPKTVEEDLGEVVNRLRTLRRSIAEATGAVSEQREGRLLV